MVFQWVSVMMFMMLMIKRNSEMLFSRGGRGGVLIATQCMVCDFQAGQSRAGRYSSKTA